MCITNITSSIKSAQLERQKPLTASASLWGVSIRPTRGLVPMMTSGEDRHSNELPCQQSIPLKSELLLEDSLPFFSLPLISPSYHLTDDKHFWLHDLMLRGPHLIFPLRT